MTEQERRRAKARFQRRVTTLRTSRNPWFKRDVVDGRAFWDEGPDAYLNEYEDNHQARTCPGCGRDTWWKATVGTYVCPSCGQVGLTLK